MLYKTDYLHSLFGRSYNTMAKSNNKTEQKLPGKAGRNSTKSENKSPANKPKMTLPTKKNETPIKDSPPKAKEMPKNPYVPSPRNRNNGDKVKEIHKILILKNQMARHLVGRSLVSMMSRNG